VLVWEHFQDNVWFDVNST